MRKMATLALLVSAFTVAWAQDSASITGTWKLHQSIAGNESDSVCTLTQSGSDLAGTCDAGMGSVKVTGKVDGKKVTWSYSAEMNGTSLTAKYEGTVAPGKIAGNVSVDPYGVSGDFTATQSTEAATAAAPVPTRDGNSPLNGKWKLHQSIAGNDSNSECAFTQNGGDLTGTCGGGLGGIKVSGKVDGKKVTWSYNTQYNGNQLTMKYEGTLDADKVSGSVTVDPMGVSGDFTATAEN